jgi:hypothetical protein
MFANTNKPYFLISYSFHYFVHLLYVFAVKFRRVFCYFSGSPEDPDIDYHFCSGEVDSVLSVFGLFGYG